MRNTYSQLTALLFPITLALTLAVASHKVPAQPISGSESGWEAYVAGLQSARALIDKAIADDPLLPEGDSIARAEGYRWVLRQANNQQSQHLGNESNAANPIVRRCPTVVCKLGWDNPDYTYIGVGPMNHRYTYRVFGQRNTVHIMLFQVMNKGGLGGGDISSSESLKIAADGSWELYLSALRPDDVSNWLQLDEQSASLLVRNIFNDWSEVEPSVQVEIIAGPLSGPPVLSPQEFARKGHIAGRTLIGMIASFIKIFQAQGLHQFPVPCTGVLTGCDKNNTEIGGFEDILYTVSRYHVPTGKALIIEVPTAPAKYRDVQLGNVWTESQDYINKHTSLNSAQDYLDEDKVYRYVLAHEDPGLANWLDISDHPYGSVMMRWIFADLEQPPQAPTAKLVDVNEIQQHIPQSHRRVSAAERAAVISERRLGANLRLNPAGVGRTDPDGR
jgi:hypothetical protein